MAKHYNSNVRYRDFQVGDLVLRKVMGVTIDPSQGKLGPNWEGPYRIVMAEERHLPPQDVGQTKALVPMEHGAPTKILPVEIL